MDEVEPQQLTGGCYYINDDIILGWVDDAHKMVPENDPLRPSDSILEKLKYTPRDIWGFQDLVLLVPKNNDGKMDIEDFDGPS